MKNACFTHLALSLILLLSCSATVLPLTTGLFYTVDPTPGVTVFSTVRGTGVYIIDNDGKLLHKWNDPDGLGSGGASYITDEGTLIRAINEPFPIDEIPGPSAGRIREYDWDGTCIWEFRYSTANSVQHRGIILLPHGHIITSAHQAHPLEEAQAKGYTGTFDTVYRSDSLIRVSRYSGRYNPDYDPAASLIDGDVDNTCVRISDEQDILWIWDTFQYDDTLSPFSIDINLEPIFSALEYIWERHQIVLTCSTCNEVFIVKPDFRHGGAEILYRWGKPENYGAPGEAKLGFPYSPRWYQSAFGYRLRPNYHNRGSLVLFNNLDPVDPTTSSLVKFTPPYNWRTRTYELGPDGAFGPSDFDFRVSMLDEFSNEFTFSSPFVGTAQWLPHGRFLLGLATTGVLYEVSESGETTWKYVIPYVSDDVLLPKPFDVELGPTDEIPDCIGGLAKCNFFYAASRLSLKHPGLYRLRPRRSRRHHRRSYY